MTVRTQPFFWILLLSVVSRQRPRARPGDCTGGLTAAGPRHGHQLPALPTRSGPSHRIAGRAPAASSFQSDDETPEASETEPRPVTTMMTIPPLRMTRPISSRSTWNGLIRSRWRSAPRTASWRTIPMPSRSTGRGRSGELHRPRRVHQPYAADDNPWDIGFLFRLGDDSPYFRLIVVSTGDWVLAPAQGVRSTRARSTISTSMPVTPT